MDAVRIAWGTGTGPTELAAYDAALADANLQDYNLVTVSSVVPAGVEVEQVGTAPDLGTAGERLHVVQARATVDGPGEVVAALGWATGEDAGVVYEATGGSEAAVRDELAAGLAAGSELRDRTMDEREFRVVSADGEPDCATAAVVVAAFGRGDPI
ncbi:pyruvoyl-dependent arginine decarboxylase subunit alpha [Halobacteriales archaeon QS_1_68_20]|nr:MAG: pyruvoyl-dependent arginine decarboxylase subunit alpha [Halobacteriales archaeon QS_1_68_20]